MIRSVGIDFGIVGPNRVRCLDEQAQLCGSFSFRSTLEGLAAMEERIFQNGSNPAVVFEPTGLVWLLMAIYLKARHPDNLTNVVIRSKMRNTFTHYITYLLR